MSEPEKKEAEPNQDEKLMKMAATIGRLQIEALATSAGAIDPAKVAEFVIKNTKADIDTLGVVKIQMIDPETGDRLRMPNADAMTPGQFIAQMKADPTYGDLFTDGAAGKPKPKATGGLTTETNPWHRDHWNLTEQGRLLRTEPVYAARLRDAIQGTLPDNPWSKEGFNLTRQSQILREDPALAERMREEVTPREPNPWMKGTENLTKQVLLIRSQPEKARRLKAEAEASNGPTKKSYIFTPPVGSFRKRVIAQE
jgi:hypothetical protein